MKTVVLLLFCVLSLWAHPHTFVDVHMDIQKSKERIDSIDFRWEFDEMTSSMMLMEFDHNGNGTIEADETSYAYHNYFMPLQEFNFYTDLKIGGKTVAVSPQNFKMSIRNNRVCYHFTLPVDAAKDRVALEFYDKDNFVAMVVKKRFMHTTLKYAIKDVDYDFYFAYRVEFS